MTGTEGCESGGVWQPYTSEKSWVLGKVNASNQVYAKFRDEIGNESECTMDEVLHDGLAPEGLEISVNDGAEFTNSKEVSLTVKSEDAFEMYLSNTPGCMEGGFWEPYSPLVEAWDLDGENMETSVFIKVRDLVGNESNCLGDSIIHDDQGPSAAAVNDGFHASRSGTDSPEISWEDAEDLGSGVSHYEVSIGTAPGDDSVQAWTSITDDSQKVGFSDLSLSTGVDYFANVRAVDLAGNVGETSSGDGFVHHYCHTITVGGTWVPVPASDHYPAGEFWA